jgi:hypothetical protein
LLPVRSNTNVHRSLARMQSGGELVADGWGAGAAYEVISAAITML